VAFDDRATHRESNTHPASLGCVERLEESALLPGIEPYPDILNAQAHLMSRLLGPDRQQSWAMANVAHRLRRVKQQIQDNLLKLNPVTLNCWQIS
jgi:hypothetical protein